MGDDRRGQDKSEETLRMPPSFAAEESQNDLNSPLQFVEHVEDELRGNLRVRRRGVFLLPNMLTTAALFAGFFAITQALGGQYGIAALAIFIAGLLDGVDGRVARLMSAESLFGKQYDSLSDLLSFGIAPAILAYAAALQSLGTYGQGVAFFYIACTAVRLARFNAQPPMDEDSPFRGLASPAAAVALGSLIWSLSHFGALSGVVGAYLVLILTALFGFMMVLNIPYRSFRQVNFRGRAPLRYLLAILFILAAIAVKPEIMLTVFSVTYALSGPVETLQRWRRRREFASTP